ncbi:MULTISPECIES: hypothetical protein [Sinorhizobium]|uniref:Transmembrane protein n=1 Tax=Sinorhizobium fredii (strain USDA 257) TaxID=1185652 RepID=I3XGX5_SINF2|nr:MULTISPECIES: hypothetical protein [Sinorhizobium]AFL55131.1 hypothetical protein USDA257_p04160 [Sinorhizobium fredii USDA 257]AWI62203.1 hypothetical protein AB395_00006580 [Sinorhizobium fredii CCBAU 45436]KSV90097.1 hypothetical protein N181_13180 [Sinorhizobium fredii USDA 205]CCE99226.1 hypothetical protein SFHH103_04755 [Sinorhizobium fredii HH103]CEO91251.1 hypothetical protein SFHH103_psfHH103d_55 [Sinorhizobium fredii HH103]
MSIEPQSAQRETGATIRSGTFRALRFIVRLPFAIAFGVVRAAVYSAWYLAFYILCMFRPFTGFMMLTAIVMVPMSIVVYAHPEAANGMPFWAFGLMALGLVAFAIGYTIFLDWFTPPGAEDPFARYRRSDR